MKIFAKIFICTISVISISLSVLGYIIISDSFKNSVESEYENAVSEYQLVKFALQSGMLSNTENGTLSDAALLSAAEQMSSAVQQGTKVMVISDDHKIIYASSADIQYFPEWDSINEGHISSHIGYEGRNEKLYSAGKYTQSGRTVILVLVRDITMIFEEKATMQLNYIRTFIVTVLIGALLTLSFSLYISRPIKKLTESTKAFENGKHDERAKVKGHDEISDLSVSFNSMAETIEDTIKRLELSAKQQEDFTSSFAHEIKTPMTSVIGYADMIYQREDLSRAEIRKAAGYILNEGLRLEALSQKLMELIVLKKQDFTLQEMPAEEAMADIIETIRPTVEAKNIKLECSFQKAFIRIEFDLFKTLMINLIDNSIKSGGSLIRIKGEHVKDHYRITVADNGRGIPAEQIERITEAFYMVDKSRSRKAHGAGLGLKIASEIAGIHNTELNFESIPGIGTAVSIELEGAAE